MDLPNRKQLELLDEVPWDVLVVLDACRADVFKEFVPEAEAVITPGRNTPAWISHSKEVLRKKKAVYFTANPIVDQENERAHRGLDTVSLWERYWGRWGQYDAPTVHPASAVAAFLAMEAYYPRPHILHLMQPHAPYIGEYGLPCICGPKTTAVYGENLPTVEDSIADGSVTWEMIRQAYKANLRLVWQAIQALLAQLNCLVVVTSDHGELLGEYGGMYGHSQQRIYKKPETLLVPWYEHVCQPELADRKKRLAALGYL